MGAELQRRYRPWRWRRSGNWLIFLNCLVSRRLTFCFLHSGRCRIAGTVGCCCVLLRQSDERPGNQHQRQTHPDPCPGCVPVWPQCPSLAAPRRKPQTHNSIPASNSSSPSHLCRCQIAWGVHNNNQQFLQYDNGQNAENRMLVNAQTFFIFMDGTFSVPPHPFKQLYTIRVPFKDVTGTLEELDAGIELCVWGFLHWAARLGHCRYTGTQPGQISGWVFLWCWLPGLSWHFWFLSTWCLYHWERDCVAAQDLDFHSEV
jgi:hypothetical protein